MKQSIIPRLILFFKTF